MEIYTLVIGGVAPDGTEFEDTVEVGPVPDLATAIMWERSALSDCSYVSVSEAEVGLVLRARGQKGHDNDKQSSRIF